MRKARFLTAALCAAILVCGFTVPAYAFSDESAETGEETTGGYEPEPTPEPVPFTPDGTGTVTDNATDEDGKEFFTITTANENVFYLVIDRQRGTENVYFLNAVTEADLAALAESAGETPVPEPTPEPVPEPTPEPDPEPEPESKPNAAPLIVGLAVLLLGGGARWYFKIYRPKHAPVPEPEEDYDEPDPYEDGDAWDEDGGEDTGEPKE